MIAKLIRAAILITLIFNTIDAFAATTHYISKSLGADTNDGTSKTTPWAHLPGMISCASNCASYSPVAGDQFIFRGGDTWVASDLGLIWRWSGTASQPIYIGVDQTWFAGASWVRPVFNCGSATTCSGAGNFATYLFIGDNSGGAHVHVDNIEFTGGVNPTFFRTNNIDDTCTHCYFHGWSHTGASDTFLLTDFDSSGFPPFNSTGSGLFYSVIDGSDTTKDSGHGIGGSPTYIVGNVIQFTANGADNINASNVHDNYWGPVPLSFQGVSTHQNVLSIGNTDNGQTKQFIYNNIITGTNCGTCGGTVKLWLDQFGTSSLVGYVFNNVI